MLVWTWARMLMFLCKCDRGYQRTTCATCSAFELVNVTNLGDVADFTRAVIVVVLSTDTNGGRDI